MDWIYHQNTGILERHGRIFAKGYSGGPGFVNNGDAESIPNSGPIPRGHWRIGHLEHLHHCRNGKIFRDALHLYPVGHCAHHRHDFFIHGDNKANNRSASEGCIVLPYEQRHLIAHHRGSGLEVVR